MSLSASERAINAEYAAIWQSASGGIFDEAHQDVQTALLDAPSARGRILQQQAAKSSRAAARTASSPLDDIIRSAASAAPA